MLTAMRTFWRDGNIKEAVQLAKAAAPFVHARPGSAARGDRRLQDMEDDQLDALCDGDGGEGASEAAAE